MSTAPPRGSAAARTTVAPTGHERHFAEHEFIVSKTDLSGRIRYANDVFLRISGYSRAELLGAAHSIVRHPEMPRGVFQYLWDEIGAGREVHAYIVNLAKNGDHYWVFAHVTPGLDEGGRMVGYHSNRRPVEPKALPTVRRLYAEMCRLEAAAPGKRAGIQASLAHLDTLLDARGATCDEFVWSL